MPRRPSSSTVPDVPQVQSKSRSGRPRPRQTPACLDPAVGGGDAVDSAVGSSFSALSMSRRSVMSGASGASRRIRPRHLARADRVRGTHTDHTEMYRPAYPDARLTAKRELGLPDRPTALFVSTRAIGAKNAGERGFSACSPARHCSVASAVLEQRQIDGVDANASFCGPYVLAIANAFWGLEGRDRESAGALS